MKTPEQIAADLIDSITTHGTIEFMGTHEHDAKDLWAAIAVKAIEADRAQRYTLTAEGTERFYGMDLEEGVHDFPFGPETHGIVDEEQGA